MIEKLPSDYSFSEKINSHAKELLLEGGLQGVEDTIDYLQSIGEGLNILPKGEKIKEYLAVILATKHKLGELNSTNTYVEYLYKESKANKIETKSLTSEEEMIMKAIGGAIVIDAINEKIKVESRALFWLHAS